MSQPVLDLKAPVYNRYPGQCTRCTLRVAAGEGEFYEQPLRLVCATCALMEGYTPNGVQRRIDAMPFESSDGRMLKLRPFQEVDALEIATARAKLIGHAMGCGKTIIASVASLRNDMGNILFCPASVKRNWGNEINLWRPDLQVKLADSQASFAKYAPTTFKTPGEVLIGSFGVLPGTPCLGCRSLRKRLKALAKEKRYNGPIPDICEHRTPAEPHPKTYVAWIDDKEQELVYHKGKKKNCDGCYQVNPTPEIRNPVVLMADECHALKNPRTDRTKNWRALKDAIWAAGGYVYGLSGTPCEGKPPEFWEVLVSLGLERAAFGNWNNYYRIFQSWYDNKKGRRRPPEGDLQLELHERLKRVQVRRRREDVLKDLPPVIEQTIVVDMDERTIKQVNEAVHHMLAVRAAWDDIKRPMNPARKILDPYERGLRESEKDRRRSIYDTRVEEYFLERPWNTDEEIVKAVHEALVSRDNLPSIEELSRIRSMLSQAKIAAVKEWMQSCEEQCEPAILFSEHVSILKKLTERPGWEVFHGGLSSKKRQELVERFQAGQIEHGMAVSIRAGGEGITLTRARVCGYIDLSWNPAKNRQALARLLRIGAEVHDSIVAVYFQAKHIVDELVQQTNFEKNLIMDSLDWDTSLSA